MRNENQSARQKELVLAYKSAKNRMRRTATECVAEEGQKANEEC